MRKIKKHPKANYIRLCDDFMQNNESNLMDDVM